MATNKKTRGLGRGLDALLTTTAPAPVSSDNPQSSLPLTALVAGKYQPRTRMDEGALNELAESIKAQGIMQPILVRELEDKQNGKTHEIIAGERRFRAAQLAGLEEIPVIIRNVDDKSAAAMALIENIQREDLNPFEEAQGIHRLISDFNFTHEQAAESIGRSRSAVTNLLRLLNLTRPVQTMLIAGDIDMGHARALLAVSGGTQVALATEIVGKRMSVREAEKLVSKTVNEKPGTAATPKQKEKPEDILKLEAEMSDMFATPVHFKVGAKGKGQLIIDFANLDVLDGILEKIRK